MSDVSEHPLVRAHRDVVERLWTQPVLDLCGAEFPAPDSATVLAAEARCGAVVLRWLDGLPEDTRMMALDSSGPMLDEARSRIDAEQQQRIFFVQQRVDAMSYADDVFNSAVCLHGLVTARQAREGLAELRRVISEGGTVMACFPLMTSFPEFYDLLDEALRACGLEDVLARLDDLRENLLSPGRLSRLAQEQNLDEVEISELSWELAFGSGREYLYSPLIQETFFPHWIGAIRSSDREAVLSHISEAIDTYWKDRTLTSEIRAALVVGKKVASAAS